MYRESSLSTKGNCNTANAEQYWAENESLLLLAALLVLLARTTCARIVGTDFGSLDNRCFAGGAFGTKR